MLWLPSNLRIAGASADRTGFLRLHHLIDDRAADADESAIVRRGGSGRLGINAPVLESFNTTNPRSAWIKILKQAVEHFAKLWASRWRPPDCA